MTTAAAPIDIQHLRHERERRAWLTTKVSIAARILGYGARLIVIPLSLKLLGTERYGLWLTVGSLIAWLGMSDFGISRGLVNAIAEASGRDDREEIRRLISSGFAAFAVLSVLVAAVVVPASSWPGIERLLNVGHDPELVRGAHALVLICGLYFALSFSLRAVGSVCEGLQEGYLGAGFHVFSAVAGAIGAVVLYWQGAGLVTFALVMAAPPVLANLGLAGYIFLRRHPDLRPRLVLANTASLRSVMHFGGPLMVVQMATLAILYSTNLLIANRLGPAEVPKYAVPYSLFMIVAGICYLIVQPYIPAYAEASRRGDWTWIRRRAFRSLGITVGLMMLADVGFVAAGREVIRVWAGESVVPGLGFLLVMAVFFVVRVWADTNGVLLIGLRLVKAKAVLYTMVAVLYVGGCWFLLPRFGIIAVPLAGGAAFLVDGVCSLPWALAHIRKRATRKQHHNGRHSGI